MNSFAEIVKSWPSGETLALDLGVTGFTARQMGYRDYIPDYHWRGLIAAAKRRGIDGVTANMLIDLRAKKRPHPISPN